MRYQMELEPRMRSMRMSSMARRAAASGCFSFQRVRPASAADLSGDWATMRSGCLGVRFVGALRVGFGVVGVSDKGTEAGPPPAAKDDNSLEDDNSFEVEGV